MGNRAISYNPIIQIAAIAVSDSWEILDEFERKIIFDEDQCDPQALKINNYYEDVWEKEAVEEISVMNDFRIFLSKHATIKKISKRGSPYIVATGAGFNCCAFDTPFIKATFERLKLFLPMEWFTHDVMCTARVFSQVTGIKFPSLKLVDLAKFCNCYDENAHEALTDVYMTINVDKYLIEHLARNYKV